MTPEQLVQALQSMEPHHLQQTAELASRMFSQKAEAIYDQDPENNGRKAQLYADIAQLLTEASMVFAPVEEMVSAAVVDDELPMPNTQRPTTVTQAVEAREVKDPWGGR